MSEKLISLVDAQSDILACAAFIAERIGGSDDRSDAIAAVLPVYLERKNVDLAAELANSVDDPFVGDKLLIQVISKCAEIDDVDYALQLSEVIEEYGLQSQAKEAIAMNLANQGKFERAFEIARDVIHPDQVLAGIAIKQAEQGDKIGANTTISNIDYAASAVVALITIAGSEIEKGENEAAAEHLSAAAELVNGIELEEERIKALCDIGTSYIAADFKSEAIICFKRAFDHAEALDSIHRDSLLALVSAGFMKAGSIELADNTLDLIIDKTQIASALLLFSRNYFENGEKNDAQDALDEAYDVLKSQHEKETRNSRAKFGLFGSIAADYAAAGSGDKAIDIAMSIESEEDSANALAHIGQILVKNGNYELAEASVMNIHEESGKMFAFLGMGNMAKQISDNEKALIYYKTAMEIAEEIPQASLVSATYNLVATRMTEIDKIQEAREVASLGLASIKLIRGNSPKVIALSNCAMMFDKAEFKLNDADKECLASLTAANQ